MAKAVALLSGGLDSQLAIAIVKAQGVEIEAVNFQTMFGCCKDDARQAAHALGVGFTLLKAGADYIEVIQNPKFGYGRGINPCVDCRIYMFRRAQELMSHTGAAFMITGEVLGQRPMSQKMKDFKAIEKETGLEGRILRPLSAHQMPLTIPEQEGLIDRSKLYGIVGRSRQKLLKLAKEYGIHNPPDPSAGCALTSPEFAKKVQDIFDHHDSRETWQFEILRMGRHFRLGPKTKIVIARNHDQNVYLEHLHPEGTLLLSALNFAGPTALFIGEESPEMLAQAAAMVLRYAQKPLPETCDIELHRGESAEVYQAGAPAEEAFIEGVRIV